MLLLVQLLRLLKSENNFIGRLLGSTENIVWSNGNKVAATYESQKFLHPLMRLDFSYYLWRNIQPKNRTSTILSISTWSGQFWWITEIREWGAFISTSSATTRRLYWAENNYRAGNYSIFNVLDYFQSLLQVNFLALNASTNLISSILCAVFIIFYLQNCKKRFAKNVINIASYENECVFMFVYPSI